MQEIPVYLFTGFMDSGKTTLIKETLFENDFGGDNRTVIIVCEDGDEEYDEAKLNTINAKVAMIEEQEDFTTETLQKIQETYKPEQIFIEYNGTWDIATLLETKMPDGWVIVQSLATVDATTFEMYLANMRAMIMEQLFKADVVIFNRCDDNTPKGKFRRAVKHRTVRHRLYTSVPMERLMRVPMKNCHLTSMQMSLILRMQIMQSGTWMHRIIRRNTMARKSNSLRWYIIRKR